MKKLISAILVMCMTLLVIPFSAFAVSAEEPIEITSLTQITETTGNYILTKDMHITADNALSDYGITLGDKNRITKPLIPAGFTGTIDGGNHTITSDQIIDASAVAFIGTAFAGTLKNIKLGTSTNHLDMRGTNANMSIVTDKAGNNAHLENITLYVDVINKNKSVNGGLLVARIEKNMTVKNCNIFGSITCNGTDTTGTIYCGAVAGATNAAGTVTIENVVAKMTANVTTPATTVKVKGILGGWKTAKPTVTIKNCVSLNGEIDVTGPSDNTNIATIENCFTPSSIVMENGASIRYSEPTGMRFATTLDAAAMNGLVTAVGAENVMKGTIITPTAYATGAGKMTKEALDAYKNKQGFENAAYLDVEYTSERYFASDDTTVTFTGSVASIKNYEMSFSAVGYIAIKVDGNWVYIYADYSADNARSVKEVATAAKNANDYGDDAAKLAILNTFIGA